MIKDIFNGYPLIANDSMCYYVKIQIKSHKKKRINKKWLKRYGYIHKQVPRKDVIFFDGTFIGHPETIEKIIKKIKDGEKCGK